MQIVLAEQPLAKQPFKVMTDSPKRYFQSGFEVPMPAPTPSPWSCDCIFSTWPTGPHLLSFAASHDHVAVMYNVFLPESGK